jgi:hypothetical protein
MEFDQVCERVEVVAVFDGSLRAPCRPVRFRRGNGRVVEVSEVGLVYPLDNGVRTRHVFDVTDGAADYRLELDSVGLVWWLTAMGDRFE